MRELRPPMRELRPPMRELLPPINAFGHLACGTAILVQIRVINTL